MQRRKPRSETGQPVIQNIRILVAFDGSEYHGWQIQKDRPTIQGTLRSAIAKITGEKVNLIGCGRTDAGVHARGLVASFKTISSLGPHEMARALNAVLPREIRILRASRAPLGFHPRLHSLSKVYRYQIYRGTVMPPHLAREHYHYPFPLDLEVMEAASNLFIGEHDFAGFAAYSGRRSRRLPRAARTQALRDQELDTRRRILRCELRRMGHRLILTVEGDGFLHHMIRNMVGTLLELGRGQITLPEFRDLFELCDRTLAGFTAPAHGLILIRVRYRS